jgi:hypothetical protein
MVSGNFTVNDYAQLGGSGEKFLVDFKQAV